MTDRRKAVVLLSGGLDSMVTAALAREQGYSVLAGSVKADELTDSSLGLDDLAWRLFHDEAEVRTLDPLKLSRGCRCDPDYVRSVITRFPPEEREAMVGDDGLILVDCAFCSQSFPISLEDVS